MCLGRKEKEESKMKKQTAESIKQHIDAIVEAIGKDETIRKYPAEVTEAKEEWDEVKRVVCNVLDVAMEFLWREEE